MKNKTQLIDDDNRIRALSKPLNVGYSWGIQAMAWGGFVFLSWLLFVLVQTEKNSLLSASNIIGLLFWSVSVASIVKFSQRITADEQSIAVVGWLGKRAVRWEDIKAVKIRYYLADMAIYGIDKKITITSPAHIGF